MARLLVVRAVTPCDIDPVTSNEKHTTNTVSAAAQAISKEIPVEDKKTFTLKQVAEHKDRNDLYMIINGKVYDISSFVDEHP